MFYFFRLERTENAGQYLAGLIKQSVLLGNLLFTLSYGTFFQIQIERFVINAGGWATTQERKICNERELLGKF